MSNIRFGDIDPAHLSQTLDLKLQGDWSNINIWDKGLLHPDLKNFMRSVIVLIIKSEKKGQMHGSLANENIQLDGNSVGLQRFPTSDHNQLNNLRVEFKLLVNRLISIKVGDDVNSVELNQFLHLISLHLPLKYFASLFYHPILLSVEERFHGPFYAVTDSRLMASYNFWRKIYKSVLGEEVIDIEERVESEYTMKRIFKYRVNNGDRYENNNLGARDFSRNFVIHTNDRAPIRMDESKIDGCLSERFPKLQVGIFSTLLEAGHSLDFTCQNRENERFERLLGVVYSPGMIRQRDSSLIKLNKEGVVMEEGYEPRLATGLRVEYQIAFDATGEKCATNVTAQFEVPLQGRRQG